MAEVLNDPELLHCPKCNGDIVLDEECLHVHSRWVAADGSVGDYDDPREEPEGEPTGKKYLRCAECQEQFDVETYEISIVSKEFARFKDKN